MSRKDNERPDIIDEDLYEEFDDEELYELVQEEKQKAYEREKERESEQSTKRPFPKWIFWLIAIAMLFNVFALLPQTFSIPAIDFLQTSAKLSQNEDIQAYKKAVVVVEAGQSKGTGFAITEDGMILTNHHVIEDERQVSVAFPEEGLFNAEVVQEYPMIDIAVLDVEGENLPALDIKANAAIEENDPIWFIGNPLRFNGIANKGGVIGDIQLADWEDPVIMMDAPVYRGNSGSPVLDEAGKVIGIIFATLDHDTNGRVGLFIPIDDLLSKEDFSVER